MVICKIPSEGLSGKGLQGVLEKRMYMHELGVCTTRWLGKCVNAMLLNCVGLRSSILRPFVRRSWTSMGRFWTAKILSAEMAKTDRKALREIAYAERSRAAITNMVYKDCPPPLVSVIGPQSSGKTTLMKSIVGHYWKERGMLQGPITMKIGHKRFTLYESTSTIENVIDTIKVSDMVILLINLSVGLQRETLETLTMINSQGVPKLCFVLTHHESRLRKNAKEIMKRIQKEFSHSVKFFHVDKAENDGYDVGGLVRHLETMKYRPVEWKCTHPHIVVDRIWGGFAYGYTRGGPVAIDFDAHIPGHGDRRICSVELLEDPCSLGSRSNALYNPMGGESDELLSSSADTFDVESREVRLFDEEDAANFVLDGEKQPLLSKDVECSIDSSASAENAASKENLEDTLSETSDISRLDDLKDGLRSRFMGTAEDDLEERFIREYRKKEENMDFEMEKKRQLESKDKLEREDMIVPGSYVRIRLDVEHDPADLLVIGGCLPTENVGVLLKGRVRKNRWQKADLKSNAPFFFSMGWFRFQSIPLFTQSDRALKYCREHSEVVFHGPSVPAGTSFFMFSPDSYYRILGTGQVLDSSGEVAIKKKLKLLGYPKTIMGSSVIVQSMFSTSREADRFVSARLSTASGLRGLLKSSIGKDGCFRSTFEGSLLMSDVIFLKCFVPMEPYRFIRHMIPGQGFVRSLRDIKEEMGLPLFEESISEDSECCVPRCVDSSKEMRNAREMKELERELPFGQRSIKEVKESFELPVPPEQKRACERIRSLEEGQRAARDVEEAAGRQKLEARRRRDVEAWEEKAEKRRGAIRECIKKRHKRRKR